MPTFVSTFCLTNRHSKCVDQACACLCGKHARSRETSKTARIYRCADCGTMRSEAEGGKIFTVCDECWDKFYKRATPAQRAERRKASEEARTPF